MLLKRMEKERHAMNRILIVEDEVAIARLIEMSLMLSLIHI